MIRLETVFPAFPVLFGNDATCIEWRGRCPVDGVGGIQVWNQVCAVLAGKAPATAVEPELLRWVGQSREPQQFSRRTANHKIREWLAEPHPPAPPRGDAPLRQRVNRPWVARPSPGLVAFPCVLDGRVAGQVGIMVARRRVVVDTPWGTTEPGEGAGQAVADGLKVRDAGFLHFLDPAFAPFWCPPCEAIYCGDHWRSWDVEGEDVPDRVWGACPRGHERLLRG